MLLTSERMDHFYFRRDHFVSLKLAEHFQLAWNFQSRKDRFQMGLTRCRNYSMAARLLLIRDDDRSRTVFRYSTSVGKTPRCGHCPPPARTRKKFLVRARRNLLKKAPAGARPPAPPGIWRFWPPRPKEISILARAPARNGARFSTLYSKRWPDDGRRAKLPGCATGADIPKASIPQPLSCDATWGDGICVASTFST